MTAKELRILAEIIGAQDAARAARADKRKGRARPGDAR